MPLSLYCTHLDMMVYYLPSRSTYAHSKLRINANFGLTNLGKLRYWLFKDMDDFERSTCGSIVLWGLRRNERKRQTEKMIKCSQYPDWVAIRDNWVNNHKDEVKLIYSYILERGYDYLDTIIKDHDYSRILEYMYRFINENDKKRVSMMAGERFEYVNMYDIKTNELKVMIKDYRDFLSEINANIYSKKRVNPKFLLTAIRNRPLDILSILIEDFENVNSREGKLKGEMDRGREANGQPPMSELWMFLYEIKDEIEHECLNRMERIYKLKFLDPIRDRDFYYKFTHWKKGLYIFGDNGYRLNHKEDIMYDLSISDIFCGFMRRDKEGNNICTFQRLNDSFDCGSTGSHDTTLWNIATQLNIWDSYNEGLLSTSKSWPHVKDLVEECDTFLGHYYHPLLKTWMSKGVRLTTDNARKAIALLLRKGIYNHIEWNLHKNIQLNEYAQLVTTSGFGKLKLSDFYDWVRRKRLHMGAEIYGITERVGGVLIEPELIKEFMSLHDEKQIRLFAEPLELI